MTAAISGDRRAARPAAGGVAQMLRLRFVGFALAVGLALGWPANEAGAEGRSARPVVVELFTSQSCYSCPPAERFLGELSRRADVIALEFHVDYWNDLNYGSAGKWKDVHSRPEYTRRQRDYNQRIRRRAGVYTPQMVIDGRFEKAGTRESEVLATIRRARGHDAPGVTVDVRHGAAKGLSIAVDGATDDAAAIWLVRFKQSETTRVLRGENHGKSLVNHNIVTGMSRIGDWRGEAVRLDLPDTRLASGEGCAVLIQGGGPGAILGAARCPTGGV